MGFILILVGMLMVITGARGTYAQFGSQIAGEFQGQNNFTYWALAIGGIGFVGYIQTLQMVSRLLMALIVLSIFLSHKGFFAKFQAALKTGPQAPAPIPSSQTPLQAVQSRSMTPEQGLQAQQSGAFGQPPTTSGESKAFGWFNYLFGR